MGKNKTSMKSISKPPVSIKVNELDNVAIAVSSEGLNAGLRLDDGTLVIEHVPQGHKVALTDLAKGNPIIRYGEVIGYAADEIARGSWIDEVRVHLPQALPLEKMVRDDKLVPDLQPIEGYTFEGFRNADGTVGTKNILGITTSVQCVAAVADYAVRRIKQELLPRYPNVDDVIALNHSYGCGVAIDAPESVIPIRTLQNLTVNPNLGGEVMVLGLGCEKLKPQRLLKVPNKAETTIIELQDKDLNGFNAMISKILALAEKKLTRLNQRRRVTCSASDLRVGLQCGGSDAFSGITANPAVGFAADLLVRAGATVVFSEVTEVRDAVHLLIPRTSNEAVAKSLIREMIWYDRYLQIGGVDRSANTTPGNKAGGLANIVEKALGSIAKSGTSPLVDVLGPGERLRTNGLVFAATPASDFVCGTLQLAAGITLQVFTTGRGTPYGLAMAPVIKVSTRTNLSRRWHDLIDLDAGRIATGNASIADVGWELFHLIFDIASGRKTAAADRLGLNNDLILFNPAPIT